MQSQSNMSSPSEIDEQLSAYFDDELEDSVRASVEAELARDPELAAMFADLSFMRTMVAGNL
jgi:anti-sigma factor RsiW